MKPNVFFQGISLITAEEQKQMDEQEAENVAVVFVGKELAKKKGGYRVIFPLIDWPLRRAHK